MSAGPGSPLAGCRAGAGPGAVFEGSEVEGHLSAAPDLPLHLVASWQQDRFEVGGARGVLTAYSTDGGLTWRRSQPPEVSLCNGASPGEPGAYGRVTDPWLAQARGGNVYLATLSVDIDMATPFGVAREAILVTRSRDGGATWEAPVAVVADHDPAELNDKPSLTVHPDEPGRLYAVWGSLERRGFLTEGDLMMAISRDDGATWSAPRAIYDPGPGASAFAPQVGVAGSDELVVVFTVVRTERDSGTFSFELSALSSRDGGVTWSDRVVIARPRTIEVIEPVSGRPVVDGAHIPALAVDRASALVYVAWLERSGAVNAVRVALSADGGRSWDATPGLSPPGGALLPALAAEPSSALALGALELSSAHPLTASPLIATCPDPSCVRAGAWQSRRPSGPPADLARVPLTEGPFVGDYLGLAWTGRRFGLLYGASDGTGRALSQYLAFSP